MTTPRRPADLESQRLQDLSEVLAQLVEASRHLRAVIDHVPAMIGYWDRDTRNVLANSAYLDWFGKTPEEIHGRHIREVIGEELYALNLPYIEGALAGEAQHFDRTIVDPSGATRYSQASYIPDVDDSGTVQGFFVLVTDVTARVEAEMELAAAKHALELRATTDPLTGLANRVLLEQRAGLALAGLVRAEPGTRFVALLLLDLDGFKPVNDRLGHAAGDELLVTLAHRMLGVVREPDLVARLGGDEFVLLLSGLSDPAAAAPVADRLVALVHEPVVVAGGEQVRVSASVGVAVASAGAGLTVHALVREADRLMYVAKRRGGDRWVADHEALRLPGPRLPVVLPTGAGDGNRTRTISLED